MGEKLAMPKTSPEVEGLIIPAIMIDNLNHVDPKKKKKEEIQENEPTGPLSSDGIDWAH